MTTDALAQKFLRYFEHRQHKVVPSSSLLPENDPTVLLTTAGMQQFKLFFLGRANAIETYGSERVASTQRCFRTSDIDRVGDATHLTFFEMLGNFSFGDYFKSEAIAFAWEFLTSELRLDPHRFSVTVFAGDADAPADEEAVRLWATLVPHARILPFGREENWWGPAGPTGPMGPCSEIHYDCTEHPCAKGDRCLPNCDCGRWVEIWNLVFVQYEKVAHGRTVKLPRGQIDTGMGLERLAMVVGSEPTVFRTDRYAAILHALDRVEHLATIESEEERQRRRRIVADHWKGVVFLLADGVTFSNKGAGSILRRLLRKSLDLLVDPHPHLTALTEAVIRTYRHGYPQLDRIAHAIGQSILREAIAYDRTIHEGVARVLKRHRVSGHEIPAQPTERTLDPQVAFELVTTYGLSEPVLRAKGFAFDGTAVARLLEEHRSVSRKGAVRKFGGHGLNDPDLPREERAVMTRMHTATHLLHQALRTVLGPGAQQAGSDINATRFRFDFTFPRKVTPEELGKIEEIMNSAVTENLPVTFESLPLAQAQSSGALAFFGEKYPPTVLVYTIGAKGHAPFSREICGGPHVKQTSEVGRIRILKEEASSVGVRRIRAVVEPGLGGDSPTAIT